MKTNLRGLRLGRCHMHRVSLYVLIWGCVVFFAPGAFAQDAGCWATVDNWQPCSGPNGCRGLKDESFCFQGCTYGFCYNNGGSGECCGTIYYSAEIYPGDGECRGDICGEVRVHDAPQTSGASRLPALDWATHPRIRPVSRLLLIPDRCRHGYVALPSDAIFPIGGM